MKYPKVSSITITYNPDIAVLKEQLRSLSFQVEKVIVVDNFSHNIAEIESLANEFQFIELIKLPSNQGIAAAQNKGIIFAEQCNQEHVVLFDHDSDVPQNFIKGLLDSKTELTKRGYKVGAIGPIYSNADTGEAYPVAKFRSSSKYTGFSLERVYLNKEKVYSEVYLLIASGCLISLDVLEDVGLMDEQLFIDNVDLEWCYRAKNKGYKVFATSQAHLQHRIGEGSRRVFGKKVSIHSNIRKYYNTRNNLFLLKYDYVPSGAKVRCVLYLITSFFIGLLDTKNSKEYIKYYFYACNDFVRGKLGKYSH